MDVLRFSPHLCVGFLFLVLCPVCVRLLRLRAVTPAQNCRLRAGVALGDIAAAFAWQTWHLWHWAGSGGEFGRRWSSFDPTWEEALASCGSCHCACVGCALFSNTFVLRFMFCCVLLYQAERHIVACHLVGRWCGMPQGCVLGANAWFVTKYDSKGDGLMTLLGTHRGTGRSVRIVVIAERPALLLTASLGRPSTVFHVKSPRQRLTQRVKIFGALWKKFGSVKWR